MIELSAPHIWVPKMKILEPDRELALPCSVRGFYKMEAVDMITGRRRVLADWFPNLITDNGLELIGSAGGYYSNICVGSGNTAPSNSDTSLATFVAATSTAQTTSSGNAGSAPWFGQFTFTYRFAAGVATGNLAEVGLGSPSNGTNLFSRALILDGGGSPTTITVLSSEALDVTYQLRNYAPVSDATGSVVISGTTYAWTARASNATAGTWQPLTAEQGGISAVQCFNGAIGAVTSQPAGSSDNGSASSIAYSAGSHQRDANCFFALNQGNLAGGLTAFRTSFGLISGRFGEAQIGFSPAIPKDASHTLNMVFRCAWGRGP